MWHDDQEGPVTAEKVEEFSHNTGGDGRWIIMQYKLGCKNLLRTLARHH